MIHFLATIFSDISGMKLLDVARWLPLIFSISSTLILYLLAKKIFNSERVGLLTAFGFSMLYQSLMFHSLFLRESLAFVMFVAAVYLYYVAISLRRMKYFSLALTFSLVCVFSHHLTPFLLVVFFVLVFTFEKLAETIRSGESKLSRKILLFVPPQRTYATISLSLFLSICLISYWFYVNNTPLQIIAAILREANFVSGGEAATISLLKNWTILYGEIAFALIFGLLFLYGVYLRGNQRTSLDIAFIAWIILMGIFSFGFAIGRIYPQGSIAVARRFQLFAYPFLFMLSGYVAHQKLKKTRFVKKLGIVLVFIFVMFSILQLYTIPPYLYSDYEISYESGEGRNILLPEEYSSILWFNGSGTVATDWPILGHALLSFHSAKPFTVDRFEGDVNKIRDYTYLIVRTVGISSIDKETLLEFDTLTWINKIYDNGVVRIYTHQKT